MLNIETLGFYPNTPQGENVFPLKWTNKYDDM